MTVVGIDFSLTSTGVCAITDGDAECITIKSSKEEHWASFPARVKAIAIGVDAWLGEDRRGALIAIESPAYAATSSALDKMFGGWWLMVDALDSLGYDVPLKVAPTQVKKFATGKGNAPKDTVLASVIRRFPDVDVNGNDQADALILAAIAAACIGEPFNAGITKVQQEIVDAVRDGRK